MSYLLFPHDPKPQFGDTTVNELVKIISTVGTFEDHQDAINVFLLILRNLVDYTAIVRDRQTQVVKITGPDYEIMTVIRYTLIGDDSPPAL